jgi:hypothetical protein
MAVDDKVKRVEVGFSGGQAIVMRLSEQAYGDLRKAVRDRDGWYELDTPDGVVVLDLSHVVFVKGEAEEHRVGFSGLLTSL